MRWAALPCLCAAGCSFAFVNGPPARHQEMPAFDCTTSRLVPILDTVWTILQAVNLAVVAAETEQDWSDSFDGDPPFSRNVALGTYVVLAGLGAAGMYYGYTTVGRCRDAKAGLFIRQQQRRPATWPPPPAPAPAPAAPAAPPPAPASPEPPAAETPAPPAPPPPPPQS